MAINRLSSRFVSPTRKSDFRQPAQVRTPSVNTVRPDAFTPARPQPMSLTVPQVANGLSVPQVELRRGSQGAQVKALQDVAVSLGYMTRAQVNTGPGIFGPKTENAVKAMQTKYGLPATGVFDAQTRQRLAAELQAAQQPAPTPVTDPTSPSGAPAVGPQPGEQSDAAKALQESLVTTGYLTQEQMNTGPGIYGPRTQNAVRALQARNGLPVTGQYDEATRAALQKELDQYAKPETMVAETYQKLLGREPTAAELGAATANATAVRDAGGSLKDMRTGLVNEIRGTEEYRAAHPLGNGAVSTAEDADNYFLTQWGPTDYNSGGAPYGYNDCGPTSAAIAMASLGLIERPSAEDAAATIDAVRDAAFGTNTTESQRMGFAPLQTAVAEYGGTTEMLPPPMIESIDAAIERGNPVVIGGNPWEAWGSDQRAAGNYLNSKDPGGHFVTVLGKTSSGEYIIADPLVKGGTIAVSEEQLKTFFGSGFGAMEVSRP